MRILGKRADYYVWRNIQLNKSRILIFAMLFILALMLFIMGQVPSATLGVVLIPIAYFLGIYSYQKYITWKSGSRGEDAAVKELSKLSDFYRLINGAVIPPNRGDTDHIILGPNGIFVIESKYYGGQIACKGDEWTRHKIGGKGKRYDLWIGSPSNQVKRNAKVLKDFLLKNKNKIFSKAPHLWVHAVLVFTNDRADIHIKNPTVDILRIDELSDFIRGQESETVFTEEEVKHMGELILRYSS
ncbi:MAG: nuclease-related domain-containing protein [Candidatus Altiarchaeota archaeon]|nr:nuclease-related domain-containing protein [Candidatus Altiarchaeota archaeon]